MMKYSADQVINGMIAYADSEVMPKLPTSGKWIVGTAVGLATTKTANLIEALKDNAIVSMLGIVDSDGYIDVDALMTAMKASADKYGSLDVEVPLMGRLTFNSTDVDRLRNYIQ